ncbi:transcriptional regulator [Microbacterium enclense]|uniref:Transcriptional regulator n=1 Tax=Microbacterium enclense TaxID=993073 RepID=A0A3S3KUY0_9MICO|nr:helix-turn-helix domain-containing protein [Microbacterium enclense]RWR16206.1 transcriptional regulator [Microbacterium enclense]
MYDAPGQEYIGDEPCALANAVDVIGERWSFFVLREALAGVTRFGEFRDRLGVATDVLTVRLQRLTDAGVLQRREYRQPGQRARHEYVLTTAGNELAVIVVALQQWGEVHAPSRTPSSIVARGGDAQQIRAALVDEHGQAVDVERVRFDRDSHPA